MYFIAFSFFTSSYSGIPGVKNIRRFHFIKLALRYFVISSALNQEIITCAMFDAGKGMNLDL